MIDQIIYEQVDYLVRHISMSHGDPDCRTCCRAEALKLVCCVPFETIIYTSTATRIHSAA